uniref:Lipase-like C-terminal domain-containing protein n=1 Tax=Globisporangium ultimum (strain ATCC 200006 / CBS 805.95 / DAOM BR144) TaxID=431595 RepID=K3WDR3_GLOUD
MTTVPGHRSFVAFCFLFASFTAFFQVAQAGNKYPIVLVHGYSGFGRNEIPGFQYWGGLHGDYEAKLKAQGYEVYTAAVGPYSSNWDRACELYAYIKGGSVNYGTKHAVRFGHGATGKTFKGLYPQWGTTVNGEVQKIHLIGHSMGGQTIRMLAQLLTHGTKGAPVDESGSSHPLFTGGHDWIHSITTISTPNQGTLASAAPSSTGGLQSISSGLFSALGATKRTTSDSFDAKLDQWSIAGRGKGESLTSYTNRISNSNVFQSNSKDSAIYSLSPGGAAEENKWVQTLPNVYYFSFSTQDTYRLLDVTLPNSASMLPMLQPLSVFLGSSYALLNGYSKDWQPNDGLVNTISMKSDGKATVVNGGSVTQPGRWHHMALLSTMDHMAVIGVKLLQDAFSIYSTHARLLYDLPMSSSGSNGGGKAKRYRKLLRGSSDAQQHHVASDVILAFEAVERALNAFDENAAFESICGSPVDAMTAQR